MLEWIVFATLAISLTSLATILIYARIGRRKALRRLAETLRAYIADEEPPT